MLMDARSLFAEAEALSTSGTGRQLVGDVMDLTDARDIGRAERLWLCVLVTTTFTSGTSSTIQFEFASDAQAAIATDGSATVHLTSTAFDESALVAGKYAMRMQVPLEVADEPYERYIGLLANVTSAAITAGAVTAFLTFDPPSIKLYPDAVN